MLSDRYDDMMVDDLKQEDRDSDWYEKSLSKLNYNNGTSGPRQTDDFSKRSAPLNNMLRHLPRAHRGQKMQIRFCIATGHLFVNTLAYGNWHSFTAHVPGLYEQCYRHQPNTQKIKNIFWDLKAKVRSDYKLVLNNVRCMFRNSLWFRFVSENQDICELRHNVIFKAF